MGKRGGNDCYQPENWAFLAEEAVDNAMFATMFPPSYMLCKNMNLKKGESL